MPCRDVDEAHRLPLQTAAPEAQRRSHLSRWLLLKLPTRPPRKPASTV